MSTMTALACRGSEAVLVADAEGLALVAGSSASSCGEGCSSMGMPGTLAGALLSSAQAVGQPMRVMLRAVARCRVRRQGVFMRVMRGDAFLVLRSGH